MEGILGRTEQEQKFVEGLESYINKITGVLSSKIITDESGKILEIHVLADFSRSPKQVVRDIQSCAATAFSLQLDHRIISVVQIENGLNAKSSRLRIHNLNVVNEGNRINIKAYLSNGEKVSEGNASGLNSQRSRYQAASAACINAVHSYLGSDCIFHISDVQKLTVAGMEAFCVAVGYMQGDNVTMLLGSSLQKGDEYLSIMKATLDAVNRVLDRIPVNSVINRS